METNHADHTTVEQGMTEIVADGDAGGLAFPSSRPSHGPACQGCHQHLAQTRHMTQGHHCGSRGNTLTTAIPVIKSQTRGLSPILVALSSGCQTLHNCPQPLKPALTSRSQVWSRPHTSPHCSFANPQCSSSR
jgi:hypothetical protein